jgi:hypothetical protein
MRGTRTLLVAGLVAVSLIAGHGGIVAAEPLQLKARSVPLSEERESLTTVGPLIYRGGVILSSRHQDFGGLSSLLIGADGASLLASTDRGFWVTASLRYDSKDSLIGADDATIEPMLGGGGRLLREGTRDAEALAITEDGHLLVGFERVHVIRAYAPAPIGTFSADAIDKLRLSHIRRFPGRAMSKGNESIEALVALDEGRVLVIAEGSEDSETSPAWILRRDGTIQALQYERKGNFRPTGATRLPDGSVLILERRFTWIGGVAARLKRLDVAEIVPGATLRGEEIASLIPPLTVDNMEGIAARVGPSGETLIYMVSDDNFSVLQRTLLMMFELDQSWRAGRQGS